jgi:DDE superfamily endonuclease
MSLVPSFLELLQPFRSQMTAPTFASLCTVLAGWVLCRRHTVTGALCCGIAAGADGELPKHHSAYHRLFSAARWSLDAAGLGVLGLALAVAVATDATVFLVVDDTLCRRRGRKVWGAGMHYDPLLTGRRWSNANRSVKSRGHSWVVLGVVLELPFRPGHYYCLPVLFRLCLNKKSAAKHRRPYRSRPELAREVLGLVCCAFPHRRFHLLIDSAYGGKDTLRNLPANCDLTARWLLDIRLCQPPPPRLPGQKGRNRVRGDRLPSPRQMLEADYGRAERLAFDRFGLRGSYRVASCLACLYAVPGRLLRVVATEPLTKGGRPRPKERAAFYSTCTDATAEQVLSWYATRWSVEVAFRDAKQELGCGQPQGWTMNAAVRTTPTLMLLYSLVVLWFAREGHRHYVAPPRPWYPAKRKAAAGFADMLAALRGRCLGETLSSIPAPQQGPQESLQTIISVILRAA